MSKFKIEEGIMTLTITQLMGKKERKKADKFPLKDLKEGHSILIAKGIKATQVKKKYQSTYQRMRVQIKEESLQGKFQVAFDEQSNLRIFKLA